ncbi:MAG: hypothetical protein ACLPWF_24910 [Bryobacteraceae bacterium]
MDRVEEIETAIQSLPPEEYQRLVQWFRARQQARWDDQMDRDCSSGKLDFLFEETDRESSQALLREWPPRK